MKQTASVCIGKGTLTKSCQGLKSAEILGTPDFPLLMPKMLLFGKSTALVRALCPIDMQLTSGRDRTLEPHKPYSLTGLR